MRLIVAIIALALSAAAGPGSADQPVNMTLTAVDGVKVGHFTLSERPTGCTAIIV